MQAIPVEKTITKRELFAKFEADPVKMLKEARNHKRSLTGYMEALSPRANIEELDAFSQLCQQKQIITRSDYEQGVYATEPKALLTTDEGKVILTEIIDRAARAAQFRSTAHTSQEAGAGDALRPYYEGMLQMDVDIQPQIPLHTLLRKIVPISGRDYRKPIIINDNDAFTEQSVAETANLPEVRIQNSEAQIRLNKRGLLYRFSYDFLSTTDLLVDHVALLTMEVATRREIGKVNQLISVVKNGDGNPNTAAHQHTHTSLGLTAGTLTPELFLRFQKQFQSPYYGTIYLMGEQTATTFQTLRFSNSVMFHQAQNPGNSPSPFVNFQALNSQGQAIQYGWISDEDVMDENDIIAIDKNRGVEFIIQMGSQLMESARNIEDQTQAVTCSETYAFCIYQQNALRRLATA